MPFWVPGQLGSWAAGQPLCLLKIQLLKLKWQWSHNSMQLTGTAQVPSWAHTEKENHPILLRLKCLTSPSAFFLDLQGSIAIGITKPSKKAWNCSGLRGPGVKIYNISSKPELMVNYPNGSILYLRRCRWLEQAATKPYFSHAMSSILTPWQQQPIIIATSCNSFKVNNWDLFFLAKVHILFFSSHTMPFFAC